LLNSISARKNEDLSNPLPAVTASWPLPRYEPVAKARFDRAHSLGGRDGARPERLDAGSAGGSGAQWFLQVVPLGRSHAGAICVEADRCTVVFHDFEGLSAVK